jgi:hypothetical protein
LSLPGALPLGRECPRTFTAEGDAPGDFYQFSAIAGHPIAGVRTLPTNRQSLPGALPLGREFLRTFTAEGCAPGNFYQFLAIAGHPIAGHPIAGVSTDDFSVSRLSVELPGALPLGREFLRTFTAEGCAPGDFYQFLAIAGHPIAGVDCGSPDCGCSDFFFLSILDFMLIEQAKRVTGEFFNVRAIAGHTIAGG